MQEEYPMQFRFRCAAVLTAVLLCSAAALPALAEETATPETADSVSTYTGWKTVNGKDYWYENGVKQGTTGRGKEIYDPDSDAWYWLDANQGGAKAVSKDVYQESNGGKWVRYDANGHMIKGWDTNDDGTYYFDLVTGAMAKGDIVVDNLPCSFDTTTGIGCNLMWHSMDGKDYWYEAGKRQGYDPNNAAYRGKEIYDPASDAWYWLDNVQQGAKTINKDVYQESEAGDWAENADGTGKWVRYDANGHMVKGWDVNENGTYYFDQITGAMAKGALLLDDVQYGFDPIMGTMLDCQWLHTEVGDYWYEGGVRQGTEGRGKEIYDLASDAWYWLDAVDNGKKAVSKDVYQESDGGKWVRYDADGHMIKGWDTQGVDRFYFDPITGAMAKGVVMIDGIRYWFDSRTGALIAPK